MLKLGSSAILYFLHILSVGRFHEKKVAVLLDFVQITSRPSPKFWQLFFNAQNVDLSDIQNDSLFKFFINNGRMLALWAMCTT